jgi:DNA-binding NarL/FixJ family response regulator
MTTTSSFQLAPGRASLAEIMDRTAHQLAQLRPATDVVVVSAPADKRLAAENEQLKAELTALKQAEATRQQAAIDRAHRLHRLDQATLRIIDRRATYRGPQVVVTMREVHLAEHLLG